MLCNLMGAATAAAGVDVDHDCNAAAAAVVADRVVGRLRFLPLSLLVRKTRRCRGVFIADGTLKVLAHHLRKAVQWLVRSLAWLAGTVEVSPRSLRNLKFSAALDIDYTSSTPTIELPKKSDPRSR